MTSTGRAVSLPLMAMERATALDSVFDLQLWSVESDPRLVTQALLPALSAGPCLVELDVVPLDGCEGAPVVCFDHGHGFDEAHSIALGRSALSPKPWSAVLDLPSTPLRVRVQPCRTPGRLLCSSLRIGPIAAGRAPRIAAIVHLTHADLWTEIAQYLRSIEGLDHLYMCLPGDTSRDAIRAIAAGHPHAVLRALEPGEDGATACLHLLEVAVDQGAELVAFLHTRPPLHASGTDASRWDMTHKLAGSSEIVEDILAAFRDDPARGVIGPYGHLLPAGDEGGGSHLPGGLFWARLDAVRSLRRLAADTGTFKTDTADAMAQAVAKAAAVRGYRIAETRQPGMGAQTAYDFEPPLPLEAACALADAEPNAQRLALTLVAGAGLREIGDAPGVWEAMDNDPQFTIEGLEPHAGGWLRVRMRLVAPFAAELPRLFLDFGSGWTGSAPLARPGADGMSESICFVPPGLRGARLDPVSFPGPFSLRDFTVEPLAAVRAIAAMQRHLETASGHRAKGSTAELYAEYSRALEPFDRSYANWIRKYEVTPDGYPALASAHARWKDAPTVSLVLPGCGVGAAALVQSLRAQVYGRWELWVPAGAPEFANDARIRKVDAGASAGWAECANAALARASGTFCAFLEADAVLHPLALHYVAEAVVLHPGVDLVFTDEDHVSAGGERHSPYFKCELNPELLLAQDMLSRLACYRTSRLRELGGVRAGFDGASSYELALRFSAALDARRAIHIPHVLHHTLDGDGSPTQPGEARDAAQSRRAVAAHLEDANAEVEAAPEGPRMQRVRLALPMPPPTVAIVIPTRDRVDLLRTCVDSIRRLTTYPAYSIVIVDNGSREEATLELLDRYTAEGATVLRDDSPFNYSALNNRAIATLSSDFVCLLNNDVEVLAPGWLEEMVAWGTRPGVGAVGARLWFPDRTLQHGGLVLGIAGYVGYAHKHLPAGNPGYAGRAAVHQSFSALTGACLLVRRALYQEVGGLDEALTVAFNDVDFCLRLREAGYRNVWTPYAELIHDESSSRRGEGTTEKVQRLQGEMRHLRSRWGAALFADPAYSPNLTLDAEDFSLAWPPRVRL